jgi:hypothetical protein
VLEVKNIKADEGDKQNRQQFSYDALKLDVSLQFEVLKDIGNKANNSLVFATIFIGVIFTIYSLDSTNIGSKIHAIVRMLGLIFFILTDVLSIYVMYASTLLSIPLISKTDRYKCLLDPKLDEEHTISSLLVVVKDNEKKILSIRPYFWLSYILILLGLFFGLLYAALVI